jgi:predicted ATPase/DNA-binding winged helix-turn-helix (wHTH) protein
MDDATALRFDRFEVRSRDRQVLRDGIPLVVGARAFDLLLALVERADRVVAKTELLDLVWPNLVVEENNLQVQISALRKLLGSHMIATIPGRGYRFAAALAGAAPGVPIDIRPEVMVPCSDVPAPAASNLPRELPPLYGREEDLRALRSLIESHRLVSIVGAGGIGKSRLAQAAAHSLAGALPDGAWMIELAGLFDPALLANVVAQALGIKISGQGAVLDDLLAALQQRTLLLVLDNCEHLLEPAAALAHAILQGAPGVNLLVTSQEPLHLHAEQQYRLMPLTLPSAPGAGNAREFGAIALFEARARAVDPRFAVDGESLALVIEICGQLDGLPLAIELAAARVASLGLGPVRDKLDARFRLLTGGSRTSLRRHQTLRAALEWSHSLLNEAERAVFRRLGVFAGGFTMQLAQAVASDEQLDEWAVLDHLGALVDKSLVVAEAGIAPRYHLLESARAFALEQLAADETEAVLRRHALAMRDFIEQADDANLDGELRSDQFAALVLPELDNLRAARAWAIGKMGDLQVAIAIATHAAAAIDYAVECIDWFVPLQRHIESGAVDRALAARYWRAIAAGNMAGRVPLALQAEAATRALALYREIGQPRRVFSTLIHLSRCRGKQGDDIASRAALDEAQVLMQHDWPAEFRGRLLRREASLAVSAGRLSDALALHQDDVRVSASTGDWRLEVMSGSNLADTLWQVGRLEEAAGVARKLAEDLRARPTADIDMGYVFANAMGILSEMGRVAEASVLAREALPIMRRSREWFVEEWAYLFWRRGQLDIAMRLLGMSDAQCARDGVPPQSNEGRLIAEARTALERELSPEAFARGLVAGNALREAEMFGLISSALSQSGSLIEDEGSVAEAPRAPTVRS